VVAATLTAVPAAVKAKTPAATQQKEVLLRADEKLFELAIAGDRDALGELIGRYEKTLFGLLLRLTSGDPHRADDLFQETFLHAMRAGKTFDRKLQFKPWVTAIAVNLVRDDARKRKVRGEVGLDAATDTERNALPEPVAAGENPGESAERKDEELQVQRALYGLTELEREVVLLHFYDSMTLVETAKVLDVPLGTIKSRLHAALTRLGGILGKKEDSKD
jgi:RNA polymerase sigma-70 factor (ECF subfamily)